MKYTFEKHTKLNKKIIRDWKNLWSIAENASIYNSYEWFQACKETSGAEEIEYYLWYDKRKMVATIPMITSKVFGVKVKTPIYSKYNSFKPILVEGYIQPLILQIIKDLNKKDIYLKGVENEFCDVLSQSDLELLITLISVNPYVKLETDALSKISKSTKYQIRKVLKRNHHKIEAVNCINNLEALIDVVVNIEQNSSKKEEGQDIFSKNEMVRFYKNIVKYCKSYVEIFILYYNSKPVNYSFNLKYRKTLIGYHTAYVNEFGYLSPGKIMLYKLIEHAQANKFSVFDLGDGLNTFKRKYTDNYYSSYEVYASNNVYFMFWWRLVNKIRRIRQLVKTDKFNLDSKYLFKVHDKGANYSL